MLMPLALSLSFTWHASINEEKKALLIEALGLYIGDAPPLVAYHEERGMWQMKNSDGVSVGREEIDTAGLYRRAAAAAHFAYYTTGGQ